MTELEYEKAGRGNLPPTMGEYAWGNSMAYQPNYAPSDEGSGVELPAYGYNVAVGYLADYTSSPSNQGGSNPLTGPQRVGSCAYQTTSRAQAGAGYYGVMDLTGNVEEEVVWLGDIASRTTYTGTHGNGLLDATGKVTNSDWLAITSFGLRGGSFYPADDFNPSILSHHFYVVTLSSRNFSALTADAASFTAGGRGVRTAP
jgi:formylglycine-generating enzyme required for sulfatase activity